MATYQRPQVKRQGDIRELTQGTITISDFDGVFVLQVPRDGGGGSGSGA